MKSMRPPSAAIFFMTYFYRAGGGGHGPLGSPGSATASDTEVELEGKSDLVAVSFNWKLTGQGALLLFFLIHFSTSLK